MGSISTGEPLEVFSDSSEAINVGRDVEQQGIYALFVKSQSMIQDILNDKAYVIIKPQNTCENGDIVVAVHLQGKSRATLKRFFEEKERDRIRLQPVNSEMEPIYIPKNEWDQGWQIQGKVLAVYRQFDTRSDAISPRQIRVFLCHSSGDKQSIRELYQRLKRWQAVKYFEQNGFEKLMKTLPPIDPLARPACVRSLIISRSNSANAPKI